MPERSDSRDQLFLMPPSMEEWIDVGHPVRFVAAFVDALTPDEWATLGVSLAPERMGAPRYAPRVLLSAWIYGFMSNVRSVRGMERACRESVPVRWLTGNQCPDHNTLARFYREHREQMGGLLKRTVETAVALDLVDLAVMAVDGTKVRANAAMRRSLDAEELAALLERTEASIAELEAQNEGGDDPPPPSLPQALRTKRALAERVRAANAACAERAAATGKARATGTPQANVTDPEARWMKTTQGIVPGYNVQAAVVATVASARAEPRGRIVTAIKVVTQPTDQHQLPPMIALATAMLGAVPAVTVADAGYHNGETLAAAAALGARVVMPESSVVDARRNPWHRAAFVYDEATDSLTCPADQRLIRQSTPKNGRRYRGDARVCQTCPAFRQCTTSQLGRTVTLTTHDALYQAHRQQMREPQSATLMARRRTMIEPVFGIFKDVLGARRTMLRGRAAVEGEWTLLAIAFNLRTLARFWASGFPIEHPRPARVAA